MTVLMVPEKGGKRELRLVVTGAKGWMMMRSLLSGGDGDFAKYGRSSLSCAG